MPKKLNQLDSISKYKQRKPARKKMVLNHMKPLAFLESSFTWKAASTLWRTVAKKADLFVFMNRTFCDMKT